MKASKILRFAVATVFAGGSAMSYAALTSTAVNVGSETPTTGVTLTASAAGELNASSATTLFAPSAGQSLQVNVTLDNGAKFGAAPGLFCQIIGVGATAGTAAGVLNLGGAGSNNAIFTLGQTEVSAVASGGSVSACTARITTLTVTGAHASINASITYQYGNLASGAEAGAIVNWKKGVSATVTAGQSVTAGVTGGFVTIAGGVSATMVSAGLVTYQQNNSAAGPTAALNFTLSASDVMTTASITVAGLPLGAAATAGGVFIVNNAAGCATANAVASATGGLASVTFSGLTPAQISAGMEVCVRFTGTSAIPEGSITANLAVGAVTGYTPDTSTSTNILTTVLRNGSSTRAMNVPAANNPDTPFIRVTNTSPIDGKLYGTLYGQDGVVLGTANGQLATAAEFKSNVTLVFTPADLKSKLGIATDWTGRAQLVLSAETTGMRAQNLVRTSNILTNMGGDTSTGNN